MIFVFFFGFMNNRLFLWTTNKSKNFFHIISIEIPPCMETITVFAPFCADVGTVKHILNHDATEAIIHLLTSLGDGGSRTGHDKYISGFSGNFQASIYDFYITEMDAVEIRFLKYNRKVFVGFSSAFIVVREWRYRNYGPDLKSFFGFEIERFSCGECGKEFSPLALHSFYLDGNCRIAEPAGEF